jgi:hypothetical protein
MNLYSTPAKVKNRLDIPDTLDDAAILAALETVSREIDRYCGRRFYVELATRYYGAACGSYLRVDDLLAVTSLKTDPNNARTYPDTWATTDYDLDPPNALLESPPEPYTRIYVGPLGSYSFGRARRSIQIVGKWGYYEVLETVGSLLNEALDASETGIDVVDGVLYDIGETLLIGSEQMYVSAIASNTLTVVRGVNGTTAASHLTGAAIQRYTYPVIGEACTQQAILAFRNTPNPTGEIGGNEAFTQSFRQSIQAGLHPFVRASLSTFRRLEVG